jgi:hypothetical protein
VNPVVVGEAGLARLGVGDAKGALVVGGCAVGRVDGEDTESVGASGAPNLRDCQGTNIKVGFVCKPIQYPAGKQKCPFFSREKWTLQSLRKDFAMTSMVAVVTTRTLSNRDVVEKSLHGRLSCHQKTSLRGPRKVHFYDFS